MKNTVSASTIVRMARNGIRLFGLPAGTVVAVTVLFVGAAFGQTGQITGLVLDDRTGEALIGASVVIEGTTMGASCDLDGRYTIRDVPPGVHVIVVSSVGYSKKRVTDVRVEAGHAVSLELTLTSGNIEMKAIEVTAERVRASESSILVKRRAAPEVTDGISAEMISKSGDSDAGDVLRRVVGVSVVNERSLVVRGMGGRYASVRLDGAPLPTPEPEKREVPLDLFPSGLLEEVLTAKTYSPDQPGSFSAGSTNLALRDAPFGLRGSFSSSGSYSTTSTGETMLTYRGGKWDFMGFDDGSRKIPEELKSPVYREDPQTQKQAGEMLVGQWTPTRRTAPLNSSYSLNLGNRYSLGRQRALGMQGSFSYSNSYKVTEEIHREYANGVPNLEFRGERGVQSVLWGSLLNTDLSLSDHHKIAFKGMYNRTADDEARLSGGYDEYIGGNLLESRLRFVSRWIGSGQLTGQHRLDGFFNSTVQWRTVLSAANRYEPNTRTSVYLLDVDGSDTMFTWFESGYSGSRIDMDMRDQDAHIALDWTLPLAANGAKAKVGGIFQAKERRFEVFRNRFRPFGRPPRNGLVDTLFVTPYIGARAQGYNNSFYLDPGTLSGDYYDVNEHTTAAFVMGEIPIASRLRLITGARYEDSDMRLNANLPNRDEDFITLHTGDWLPMSSVVWGISERMNLRGVVSRTLARPEYREMAPFTWQDYAIGRAKEGNADLRVTYIVNYDLRWEYFPAPGEVLAVSVFTKSFTDPIEHTVKTGASRLILTWINTNEATNRGIEFEARKTLGFLAESFSRLTFGGNLTLVTSEIRHTDETGVPFEFQRPLQGQSPFTLNGLLTYTSADDRLEATLLYNAFGRRLAGLDAYPQEPWYEEPRHQVDVTFGYKIWESLALKGAVKNLAGAEYHVTQLQTLAGSPEEGKRTTMERHDAGQSISLGLSYAL